MPGGILVSFGYSLSAELEGSRYYYFRSGLEAATLLIFGAMIESVSIIGNGKVARYVHRSLLGFGVKVQVYARNPQASDERELKDLATDSDLCLICISDDRIGEVSRQIPTQQGILAHSSGSVSLETLDKKHPKRGIFYPLMSINEESQTDLSLIPFCLEANDASQLKHLEEWCSRMGLKHYHVPSTMRRQLHLAAVVSHNFSNYFYHWAFAILKEVDLPLEILKPLLQQQVQQLDLQDPIIKQTGPAVRGDQATMQNHIEMLTDRTKQNLYRQLSHLIQNADEEKL